MGKHATYKLPNPLTFELRNPNYTIYHRAALGGLAATARAWEKKPRLAPSGIRAKVCPESVELSWDEGISDQEAIRRMLDASFKLTEDKLIELPGQGVGVGHDDLRLAIHTGLCGTFLQHNKMRPGEKEPRRFVLKEEGDEEGNIFTYKAVNSYAHQKAQGTDLLDEKLKGALPDVASIPQSVIPGAMSGATGLEGPPDEVFLLMFLMVGASIFLLRPRTHQEKAQYCLVIPDVSHLLRFADNLQQIATFGQDISRFTNTYLGRVVGGVEEAALRFLIDLHADALTDVFQRCISGCLAVAMGKVAWDANQVNRSVIVKLKNDYEELAVFRSAAQHFSKSRVFKSTKGGSYAVPPSPIPELIAANLAAERHWCAHFRELCKEQKDFRQFKFQKGGLVAMKAAVKNNDDRKVIDVFQEAWKRTMGQFWKRAENLAGGSPAKQKELFSWMVEREQERIRNAVLRTKTADALAGWFLRFCAEATEGKPLSTMQNNPGEIREFIFNGRNFERFQNLCLFALVSYASDEAKTDSEGGINQ